MKTECTKDREYSLMRAWILEDIGRIHLTETDQPKPREKEVLIKVQAAGICGSDLPRIYETGAHQMPLIPGHEFSGTVAAAGSPSGKRWLGKRVGVFPLIPCGQCMCCRDKKYEMCSNYSYLGSRQDGGFAEYAAVPEWNLIELPDAVSFEEAAMLEPLSVAVHALRRMHVRREETIIVYGLGTIGMMLVSLLLGQGMEKLFVVGNKDIQRTKALALGIPEENYCDSKNGQAVDWCISRTGQRGADVVFECVGKSETCSDAIGLAAPGGRICLVGNPSADMHLDKQVYWKILRRQMQLCGTWNSSFAGAGSEEEAADDWHYALDCIAGGQVRLEALITHRFSLEELDLGLEIMRDKTEEYIKVMCVS